MQHAPGPNKGNQRKHPPLVDAEELKAKLDRHNREFWEQLRKERPEA